MHAGLTSLPARVVRLANDSSWKRCMIDRPFGLQKYYIGRVVVWGGAHTGVHVECRKFIDRYLLFPLLFQLRAFMINTFR